jgi:1-acyl-sn-glycerol-3-phosphate acyltransferase
MNVVSYLPVPKGPKIIVANHPTTSDPFILTSISNGQAAVLVKESLFDVPVFGRYLYWAGHVPVKKSEGKEAFEKALTLLKNGVTIIIFIEGDLSEFIHKIGKPKTGAVRLALLSGASIIPMGIGIKKNNIKMLSSVIKGVQEWGKWYLKGPYAITVGKPIKITGDIENRTNVKDLSKWLSEKISKLQKESLIRINGVGKLKYN